MPSVRAAWDNEPSRSICSSSAILPGPMATSRPKSTRKRTAGAGMLATPGPSLAQARCPAPRSVARAARLLRRYIHVNITAPPLKPRAGRRQGAGKRRASPRTSLERVAASQDPVKHRDHGRLGAVNGRQGLVILPTATETAVQLDEILGSRHLRC